VPFRQTLPIANLVACLFFILQREPTPLGHLAEIDKERQRGGILIDDSALGVLACRTLYAWSTFHGGEAIGVAALEVLNLPSLVLTAIAGVSGDAFGFARLTSACRWSWLLAGVFIGLASVQWWLVGTAIDRITSRTG
jgi:hypothetical protein